MQRQELKFKPFSAHLVLLFRKQNHYSVTKVTTVVTLLYVLVRRYLNAVNEFYGQSTVVFIVGSAR